MENPIILSIFPNRRGFGYACVDVVDRTILEKGIVSVRPSNNERVVARIKRFIEFHEPTILILRDAGIRFSRLSELNALVGYLVKNRGISVYRYSRKQVRDVFEVFGAINKDEIAKQIIVWFPELVTYQPKIRKPWKDEDYHMGVFDAMALAITYQYLSR